MCYLVHVADLPQDVADAITADVYDEAMTSLDVDSVESIRDEWYDDDFVPVLNLSEEPLADVRRTIEVDARRRENPPTQVV